MRYCLMLCILFCSVGLARAQQLIPAAERAQMLSLIPYVADDSVRATLEDPTLVLYDEARMPVYYQIAGGGNADQGRTTGFSNAKFNISGDFPESRKPHGVGGNANTSSHFPWTSEPGLTHRAKNVADFKAFWLPKKPDGTPWPVVWYRVPVMRNFSNTTIMAYNWTFPVGTRFFEFAVQQHPTTGEHYVFDIRMRERELDGWAVDAFRPYRDAAHLASLVRQMEPQWQAKPKVAAVVYRLEDKQVTFQRLVLDSASDRTKEAFRVHAWRNPLPDMGRENDVIVEKILDQTAWQSVLGVDFQKDSQGNGAAAPYFDNPAGFSVTAARADIDFTRVNRESCARCHRDTLTAARRLDRNIGWYGFVRGNLGKRTTGGGILSWHPVEPSSIRFGSGAQQPRMRAAFVTSGILEPYVQAKHPADKYTLLRDPL